MKGINVICGNNIEFLKTLEDNSIDSVVTDPPYGLGKEPDANEMLKAWLETGYMEVSGKGFMGKCYSDDTEILTEDGWMFIKNIVENKLFKRVYTLNPDTRQIELSDIIDHQKYRYKGNLLNFKGRSVDLLVTPNHNMVIESLKTRKICMIEAQKIPQQSVFLNTGNWMGKQEDFISIGNSNYPIKDFMFFFGIFIGDGCVVNRKTHKQKQDFISIAAINKRKRPEIIKCLERLQLKHNTTSKKDIYIYDKNLLKYLKQFGKASDKFIPNDFFKYCPDILSSLLDGIIITDGHKTDRLFQFCTISSKLKNDFQRLVFLCGRSSTINKKKTGGNRIIQGVSCKTKDSYTVTVLKQNKKFYFEKQDHKSKKKRLLDVNYDGFVYDITANENHILYVRRNGKCLWSSNSWDSFVPQPVFWKEVYRVLKPGGHILSFFGTRTYDWGVMAIRLAGFEIRDSLQWVYGSGFPKSHNISKAIDKMYGAEREISGTRISAYGDSDESETDDGRNLWGKSSTKIIELKDKPATEQAKQFDGWGSALKPAVEPIVLARKPLEKGLSIADNVLKWGTGAINIDGCRVGSDLIKGQKAGQGFNNVKGFGVNTKLGDEVAKEYTSEDVNGRFPANLILTHHPDCECVGLKKVKGQIDKPTNRTQFEGTWNESNTGLRNNTNLSKEGYGDDNGEETIEDWNCVEDCPIKILDEQSGESKSSKSAKLYINDTEGRTVKNSASGHRSPDSTYSDKGGSSRFFYCAKTSKSERNWGLEDFEETISSDRKAIHNIGANNPRNRSGKARLNIHPTVKPVKLMQYLARLITPTNGLVLDPFNGSGTTGIACKLEGFNYIGLEISEEYCEIARNRIESWDDELENMIELKIKEIEREQKKDDSQLNLF